MIRRELPDHWLLIPQTVHAALSGSFAALWTRTELRPRRSVICAIGRHDEGWRGWEQRPKTGGEARHPLDFPELSLPDNLAIWSAGPREVAARDPYAGLLVSLHGASLMERKLALAEPDSEKAVWIRAYLAGQRQLRADLVRCRRIPKDLLGPRLDANLHLLQLLDFLSLLLCWRDVRPRRLAFGRPEDAFRLDLTPAPLPTIDSGSARATAPAPALRVCAGVFPWPFGGLRPRRFRVAAYLVAKVPYEDQAALRRALDDPGTHAALEIHLNPGPGPVNPAS